MPAPVLVKPPETAVPPGWPVVVPSATTALMFRSDPFELVEMDPAPPTVLMVTLLPSRRTRPGFVLPRPLLIVAVVAAAWTVTVAVPESFPVKLADEPNI